MAELQEITSGLEFPEGPVAMSDGSVIVTEIQGGRITRVAPDGSKDVVAECGRRPERRRDRARRQAVRREQRRLVRSTWTWAA